VGTPTTIDVLREAVVFVLEVDDRTVTAASTLEQLGIDSLAASQVLIEIEIRLGREVDFEVIETLGELSTLADLAQVVDSQGIAPAGSKLPASGGAP
jgi:acyl carrier protein